jgi:hypothetical protein
MEPGHPIRWLPQEEAARTAETRIKTIEIRTINFMVCLIFSFSLKSVIANLKLILFAHGKVTV